MTICDIKQSVKRDLIDKKKVNPTFSPIDPYFIILAFLFMHEAVSRYKNNILFTLEDKRKLF